MDLSRVKWVVIIAVVVGIVYFLTGPGIDSAYNKATKAVPGIDPDRDAIDEATISKYAGYLGTILRYEKSEKFYTTAIERYGAEGKNYWYNIYKRARCRLKLSKHEDAANDLYYLWKEDGDSFDERVPEVYNLKSQLAKLIELYDLDADIYPNIIE